jgi:hypothetical protein
VQKKEMVSKIRAKCGKYYLLAQNISKNNVLNEKSIDDCMHIAYAVVYSCDAIVSWNFSHLVNFKTIRKVKVVNAIRHYKEISIISPTMLLEEKS